jgi:hypothetical protein
MASSTLTTTFTEQLDRFESSLPAIPARIVRLQRTLAGAAYDQYASMLQALTDSTKAVLGTARVSGKTVTGQVKSAGEQIASVTRTGARTVAGQTAAQGRRVSRSATGEATKLLDDAIDAVDSNADVESPGSGRPYEQWTKSELLERARQLDIEGRTGLNKAQLIKALRKHS